ncbi:S8 family peptidase [Lewinella sp. IMCC34191]|uniref:S8 family peptidase n=1 Tax=Lewinella sp. IMCC34191 TaxID=2259172 RepID=UPI000E2861B7|nr:S8 family peptidase [Lewinella sp. IMCC34191]
MRLFLVLCLLLGVAASARAQRIATELICAWQPGANYAKVLSLSRVETESIAENITLLRFPDAISATGRLASLQKDSRVSAVQYNYRVQFRRLPDDPLYIRQENMQRSGFEEAWDLTTGGRTPDGVPIVTAVLDAGFDTGHEDLAPNLWNNPGEIPDDGIDNDDNGYVDDRTGWNMVTDAPEHPANIHGTAVAGLLGARGHNGIGVSGTNWNAQLMLFTISNVADIIEAYQYIIDQRRLFRTSGGRQGAFVVSTNASFGIEDATCDDFPVWGSMYDRLGEEGILTAASVANVGRDADLAGDMAIDCPSNFLIGVTNVDEDDVLFTSSGYGRINVDLAAPGEASYTTRPDNDYGSFGSTSAAAPYITGAISLLYASSDCDRLRMLIRDDPSGAALLMRRAILESVRPAPSLASNTATGGILDVAAAQVLLLENCASDDEPLAVDLLFPNPAMEFLYLRTTATSLSAEALVWMYDVTGRKLGTAETKRVQTDPVVLELNISDLAAGYYLLQIVDGPRRATANFIKW